MAHRERVHVEINDATIASGDSWAVIHRVWWSATIYDGPAKYEHSLESFSLAQRYVFAIRWYVSEVSNGGHKQFYGNSTGIVWEDARDGFIAIGLPHAASIIKASADCIGGSPSLDHQERLDQLEHHQPDFEGCDDSLYALLKKVDLEAMLISYIRSRPSEFYFAGEIVRVVLPGMKH